MNKLTRRKSAENNGAGDAFFRDAMNLRDVIIHAQEGTNLHSILVSGMNGQSGTTSLIIAMSLGLRWDGKTRVILIDANFEAPRLHKVFNLNPKRGLHSFLRQEYDITDLVQETKTPRLQVIPTAPISADSPTLNSDYFTEGLKKLRGEADVVITDGGAISANPQAFFWSASFDGAVLVADAMQVRKRQLRQTVRDFRQANANLLGVILNREKPTLPQFLRPDG